MGRIERLGELLREEIGEIIHDELKDPRIGFVTVTSVEVTADTRHARVRLSVLGSEEEREASLEGLHSAQGVLRRELGSRVRMKFTPELHFSLDTSAEHSVKIGRMLQRMRDRGEITDDDDAEGEN